MIVIDRDTCTDYELFAAYPHEAGVWTAGSGAIFNLRSDHLRPAGWTSADAAGLPIFPGLARYDEVARGAIDHALRFTAPCTARRLRVPGAPRGLDLPRLYPPMGLRVRLKASVDISRLPYQARVVAQALKTYGLILADNGSPWYISGAPNPQWNDDALHQLDELHRPRLRGRRHQLAAAPRPVGTAAVRGVNLRRCGLTGVWATVRLTGRDLETLSFAAEHRLVLADHVAALLGISAGGAATRLRSLSRAGFLTAHRPFERGAACFQITPSGAGRDRQPT